MRKTSLVAALAVLLMPVLPVSQGLAARDWLPSLGSIFSKPAVGLGEAAPKESLELLVFEVEGCVYCEVLRRDVFPRYRAAPASATAPMRFVDINKVDTDTLALRGALRVVPTVVLMKDGKEVERIDGYTGPEMFFQLVARMIEKAQ